MGSPHSSITFGIPIASSDGRYYSRYPNGDRFSVFGNATGALLSVIATAPAGMAGTFIPSASLYAWDDLTPYAWVYGAKTDPGDGTQGNPFSPAQALAIGPAAAGDRVIKWLPSDYAFSSVSPGGYKYATVVPTSGASSTRRVIHQAMYPGDIDPARRTRIRRTGGAGSILGFYNTNHAIWDGFVVDTKTLLTESSDDRFGEAAQLSAWYSNGCKFIRCYTDHQGALYLGSNRCNLFMQYVDDMEVADSRFTHIGNSNAVGGNVNLVEMYESTNVDIHHNEFWNAPFAIWSKGQRDKPNGVHTHRYHHNIIRNCGIGIGVSNPINTMLARAHWLYQNLIYECQAGISVSSYGSNEPKGIIIANNTIFRGRSRTGSSEFYGFQPYGITYINSTGNPNCFASDCLIVTRNNAVYDVAQAIYQHENNAQYNNLSWDRNLYNATPTAFWRQGEGGPIGSFSSWQAQTPSRDPNGLTSAPQFQNYATNDVRPNPGSPLINAGTDYLNLLGLGTGSPINIGAHIQTGESFGPRI